MLRVVFKMENHHNLLSIGNFLGKQFGFVVNSVLYLYCILPFSEGNFLEINFSFRLDNKIVHLIVCQIIFEFTRGGTRAWSIGEDGCQCMRFTL